MLIGVYGSNEGLENTPNSSPGVLQPPPKPRAYELLTRKACRRLGIPVIPAHLAIMTQIAGSRNGSPGELFPDNDLARRVTADSMRGRAACYWATPCGRGCSIRANFQSTTVLLPPALATGNLEIRTGRHGPRGHRGFEQGRATGVHYIDKDHPARRVRRGARGRGRRERVRVARASSSTRPAPSSRTGWPTASGLVGKYVMDTVGASVYSHIPALQSLPPHNEDGASAMHMYMPWWLYGEQLAGQLDFPRGYHIEFGGGRRMPGFGAFARPGAPDGRELRPAVQG